MKLTCDNCFHKCTLDEGAAGFCRVWKNDNNSLVCTNYGQITSIALDPIEKKPLYEFHPGSMILSIGSYGCNLRCAFCQNYTISQYNDTDCRTISPEELAKIAVELKESHENIGVAYTYNEPLISYPYLKDCMELIHNAGMVNVIVSNGTVSANILSGLLPLIDAMNIDLKGFSEEIYKKLGGNLNNVMENILLASENCHVEITSLIVPEMNDDPCDMENQAKWIASVDPLIPLHITRYFPRYRYNKPATSIKKLHELAGIAQKHLNSVYLGNC